MSYQVLARKYRPQKFSDVVGQDHITTTLKNAIKSGRLHHAYLFTGARGIGKTTVARILAKALNCSSPSDAEPCGECQNCREITSGSLMDVQEIDGASNNSVDAVREISERVRYMPSSAKYKIYIVDEVHMLSTSAFNALLKTLEEPPAHVIFMFATTESHKIPATILSRCQRYDFRRIPSALIAKELSRIAGNEGIKVEDSALRIIAHEATGSLRDAESLFDQAIAFSGDEITSEVIGRMLGTLDRKRLYDFLGAVMNRDSAVALSLLEDAYRSGIDLVRFASEILELIRHMLVISECKGDSKGIDLPPDEVAMLGKLVSGSTSEEMLGMFNVWYRIAEDVSRSAFPKMLLEIGVMRMVRASDVKNIGEVLARIDDIVSSGAGQQVKDSAIPAQAPSSTKKTPEPAAALQFEPASSSPSPFDGGEGRWLEFMRWVSIQRPQVASILQNGVFVGIDDSVVKLSFNNMLYADMLTEEDRKKQLDDLLEKFFKSKMSVIVGVISDDSSGPDAARRKREMMREALGNDIVKKTADILNARVHDVKVEGEDH